MTSTSNLVVVGIDGTDESDIALEWAAREAQARGGALRIVHAATHLPDSENLHMYDPMVVPDIEERRAQVNRLLDSAAQRATNWAPGIEVSTAMTERERPARALVAESLSASMVVIGSRHLGAIGSVFLGSVGSAVAQRSACPVVVVRGPAGDPAERARVVVGVDGQGPADAVLAFAFEHASVRGVPLEAVLCWPPDPLTEMSWRQPQPAPERAAALASEVVAGWREKYPDVEVHVSVVRDRPAAGLVAASAAQDLLVVGRHGRHVLPGVVLGSTSMGVLHHATCPVAVVPQP